MQNRAESSRFFAIVPAAGRSARMGQPKLLLPWGKGTLVEHVLAAWRTSCVTSTTIVVHPEDIALADICRRAGAAVVVPPSAPEDMKASIGHALAYVAAQFAPCDADAWLVTPADMPGLSALLINHVIAAHDPTQPRIVVPVCEGRRGHPVLFPWPLASEVPHLGAGAGLKLLLERHPVLEIPWPDATAFADVDSPADYDRWCRAANLENNG